MKTKILFCAMIGISIMAFAKVQAVWTSTCGVKHYTTFSDSATYSQMISSIQSINELECGTRPNVSLNLP